MEDPDRKQASDLTVKALPNGGCLFTMGVRFPRVIAKGRMLITIPEDGEPSISIGGAIVDVLDQARRGRRQG